MSCDANSALRTRIPQLPTFALFAGILADQASKSWACLRAAEPHILVPGYVAAYAVENPGAIFGLAGDRAGTNMLVAFLGIALAALLGWIAYADRRWSRGPERLACALLVAGILGNTLDRLLLGHVRDFLVTSAFPAAVFNLADLIAAVGVALLFLARGYAYSHARPDPGFKGRAAT